MDSVLLENVQEFINIIIKVTNTHPNKTIHVVAKYCETREILNSLIQNKFQLASLYPKGFTYGDYGREYLISIFGKDVWCKVAWNETTSRYNKIDGDICYVFDDCNSRVLSGIDTNFCVCYFLNLIKIT